MYRHKVLGTDILLITLKSFFLKLISGILMFYAFIKIAIIPRPMAGLIFYGGIIGTSLFALGLFLILSGMDEIVFYYRRVKKYHKEYVKIKMKDERFIEGTLFITKQRLIIVSEYDNETKSKSYSFIHENQLDEIEKFCIDDVEVEEIGKYFKMLLMVL